MNQNYIRSLIKLVEDSNIGSLEVSSWGRKIRITGRGMAPVDQNGNGSEAKAPMAIAAPAPVAAQAPISAPAPAAKVESSNLIEVKSPMVGTFYAAPSPDSSPYVSVNEKISVGQVVCIVEAMKLMNEIEAEVSGRIAEVCVQNGQPVEFGQILFKVDPTG